MLAAPEQRSSYHVDNTCMVQRNCSHLMVREDTTEPEAVVDLGGLGGL